MSRPNNHDYDLAETSRNTITLARLARDKRVGIRWLVAHNKCASLETLAYLAQDEDRTVRYYVANNPNTPKDVRFLLLLEYPEWVK